MIFHPHLARLLTWQENWNGYNALAVFPQAVEYAQEWLIGMQDAVGDSWTDPMITSDCQGGVVFWWVSPQHYTLEVYIDEENTVEYMKVWGRDPRSRIDDGDISSLADFLPLWYWLFPSFVLNGYDSG